MSTNIKDYLQADSDYQDQIDSGVGAATDGVTAVTAEVTAMGNLITTLQNSPGEFTPADQKTVDALQARQKTAADALKAVATGLTAVQALNPPTPPAVPA